MRVEFSTSRHTALFTADPLSAQEILNALTGFWLGDSIQIFVRRRNGSDQETFAGDAGSPACDAFISGLL